MGMQSIKTRIIWSYLIILVLFMVQLPIVYVMIDAMSKKYHQIDMAGALRKRAVEINYLLNRYILNREGELKEDLLKREEEYSKLIEQLKNGSDTLPAITDEMVLRKLSTVEQRWRIMENALAVAIRSGNTLTEKMNLIENSTFPYVKKIDGLVKAFVALNDPTYSKSIDLAGLQRMRTVKIGFLLGQYVRANYDRAVIGKNLKKTMREFEDTLRGLGSGSERLGLKAVEDKKILAMIREIEGIWAERKEQIFSIMEAKDTFVDKIKELAIVHTPQLVSSADAFTKAIAGEGRAMAMRALIIMAVTILFSVAIAGLFMWSTNHHIIKPLIRIKETVEKFASGDLTRRAHIRIRLFGKELKDEIVGLGESVDKMVSQMSLLIGRITDSSTQLAFASEQLSTSSGQIKDGAKKQSTQTDQAATAIEEMNATLLEVAKNSQEASDSAKQAQEIAEKGGDVVTQAITAMKEVAESTSITAETIKKLGRSSEEIGTIVSVINDIADQTNLLALNAAIEAARAGEQGRGFAVVADEVRKLAERTTKATKEISDMINTIQAETGKAVDAMAEGTRKVENGVKLANEAGDALGQIVTSVENVTNMIRQIATSTEEQSSTAEEISRNMEGIADVARRNVSTIGEMVKATDELAVLAMELKDLVAGFKIADEKGMEDRRSRELKLIHRASAGIEDVDRKKTAVK